MPQKSWAVGEEVLAADFNTYAQNQVVPQFTNTAQRDAQWTAPPNGATCVTVDTGTLWQRIGGAWYKPYGVLGFAERTTSTAAITAETSLGMDLTVTVPAGRRIELALQCTGGNGTAGAQAWMSIKEGATFIVQHRGTVSATTNWTNPFSVWRIITPTAASHTYSATVAGSAGTVFVGDTVSQPITFVVRDVGAA